MGLNRNYETHPDNFYNWYYDMNKISSIDTKRNFIVWIDGLGAEWLPLFSYYFILFHTIRIILCYVIYVVYVACLTYVTYVIYVVFAWCFVYLSIQIKRPYRLF